MNYHRVLQWLKHEELLLMGVDLSICLEKYMTPDLVLPVWEGASSSPAWVWQGAKVRDVAQFWHTT